MLWIVFTGKLILAILTLELELFQNIDDENVGPAAWREIVVAAGTTLLLDNPFIDASLAVELVALATLHQFC